MSTSKWYFCLALVNTSDGGFEFRPMTVEDFVTCYSPPNSKTLYYVKILKEDLNHAPFPFTPIILNINAKTLIFWMNCITSEKPLNTSSSFPLLISFGYRRLISVDLQVSFFFSSLSVSSETSLKRALGAGWHHLWMQYLVPELLIY